MTSPADGPVDELVSRARDSDDEALDELVQLVHDGLVNLTGTERRHWSGRISIQTTSLLDRLYVRLSGRETAEWHDRAHFMAAAATAMRRLLINHVRRDPTKRGDLRAPVDVDELENLLGAPQSSLEVSAEMLVALDSRLSELAREYPREAKIIECRVFAGMSIEESAEALTTSTAIIKRGSSRARALLSEPKHQST